MTAAQYFRVVARFRWLVASCLLAGLLVSVLVTATSGTTYTSVSRVQLVGNPRPKMPPSEAHVLTLLAQQRVPTYADLAEGTELTSRLLADGSLSLSTQQLRELIEVRTAPGSTVITIVVRDSRAGRTRTIASRAAAELVAIVTDLELGAKGKRPLLSARVIADASVPVAAVAPPPWRNPALGAAAGLVLGLAAAVAAGRRSRRLMDVGSVEESLAAAPVLGVLPTASTDSARRDDVVREVGASLLARHPGPGLSLSVALTSPTADARVHLLAEDLAATLAGTGAEVLLVDADLRSPRSAPLPGLADLEPGLADVLAGAGTVESVTRRADHDRCDVVPAGSGTPRTAELLHSAHFQELLDAARERYAYVLVVPPATSVATDALAVAARCDHTLLAIGLGRTRGSDLEGTLARLARVRADVVGAVVLR